MTLERRATLKRRSQLTSMYKTIIGGLVRKDELKEKDGRKFLYFSIAENFSKRKEDGEWEDVGTLYQDCSISGYQAVNFDKVDIPLGTRLIVSGRTGFSPARTYTNKEGVEVDVPASDTLYVDNLGIAINNAKFFNIDNENSSSNNSTKSTPKSDIKDEKSDDDIDLGFDDNSTSETSSDDIDDLFGDWDL